MTNTGLVSVSFRKHSPEEILENMQKASLRLIEWGSDIHAKYDDTENLKRLFVLSESYGVKCCSYGTYFRFGESDVNEIHSYINAAKILGTDTLRVWCGNKASKNYSEAEYKNIIRDINAADKIAFGSNVKLCFECHINTLTDCKDSTLKLFEDASVKSTYMYWQPQQDKTFEENILYAKSIAEKVVNVHVFNWDKNGKYKLCDGVGNWKKYFEILGKSHNYLLEFMPDDNINSLCGEADTLRTFTGGM